MVGTIKFRFGFVDGEPQLPANGEEAQADRAGHLGGDPGRAGNSGVVVDWEHHDGVTVLAAHKQPLAGWIDYKVAGLFDPFLGKTGQFQFSAIPDGEGGDTVVAAVGTVDKFACGVCHHLCGVAFAFEVFGQGTGGVESLQFAG